jgi:hypothetical protein
VPPNAVPAPDYLDAHSFVGYPEFLAQQLNERVSNASCPGETTSSMLVAGVQSNGCENARLACRLPDAVPAARPSTGGTQMDYALTISAAHKHTRLVTIDIGANDVFLCQETTADHCTSGPELNDVANEIATNLGTIFHELRDVAGYRGPIVGLTYYSLSYSDPVTVAGTESLDSVIAGVTTADGGIVADGFAAFEDPSLASGGDPCAAGLLIKLPTGPATSIRRRPVSSFSQGRSPRRSAPEGRMPPREVAHAALAVAGDVAPAHQSATRLGIENVA